MSVRFAKPRDPRKVPQFTLWTMHKNGRVREARTRLLPIINAGFELGIYEQRSDGSLDLLWSHARLTSDEVNTLAQQQQREYEADGWTIACAKCNGAGWVCEAHPDSPLDHLRAEVAETCDGAGMPCACEIGQQLAATLDAKYRSQ
jgi:hypothetical protein